MPIRLGRLQRSLIVGVTLALAATGVLWLVPHHLLAIQGEFGVAPHPLEPWALRLHGAAAMGFLVALGSLLPVHIRRAWQVRENIRTGATMLAVVAALIATAYGLYYASSEVLRPWLSTIHWSIGLCLVPALFLHERQGSKIRASAQPSGSGDRLPLGHGGADSGSRVPGAER
jgi:cation transport ATPase